MTKKLKKIYRVGKSLFTAVDGADLEIAPRETFSLIGESGSGKSTLARMILGLIEPTSGDVYFEGKKKSGLLPRQIQMIFQDPYSSLNPRMTIEQILKEPTQIHGLPHRVEELLDLVRLEKEKKYKYPHELSGGQRQRVGIARALALNPRLLICDEPISSLDAPIQKQILHLLMELKTRLGLTVLFISHDLEVVREISDRVAIMQKGQIVECGVVGEIFQAPQHAYTQALVRHSPL